MNRRCGAHRLLGWGGGYIYYILEPSRGAEVNGLRAETRLSKLSERNHVSAGFHSASFLQSKKVLGECLELSSCNRVLREKRKKKINPQDLKNHPFSLFDR